MKKDKNVEQSWETCKYGQDPKDPKSYICNHPDVAKLYPNRYEGETLIGLLYPIPNLEFKHGDIAFKLLDEIVKDLKVKIDYAPTRPKEKDIIDRVLTPCKHCKYYEAIENGTK